MSPPQRLTLYVWGPAFGLPSIDAECLAAIALLNRLLHEDQWLLVISHDTSTSPTGIWRACTAQGRVSITNLDQDDFPLLLDTHGAPKAGFRSISSYLRTLRPSQDPDSHLTPQQRCNAAAVTAHIQAHARPLLAAHLFADPLNHTACTRPAYSRILPFPTTFLIPPRRHDAAIEQCAHLGLTFASSPEDLQQQELAKDADPSAQAQAQAEGRFGRTTRNLIFAAKIPRLNEALKEKAVKERFRVEAAADALCAALDELLRDVAAANGDDVFILRGEPSTVDCLCFGHLSLLLYPDVPRNWTSEIIRRRWSRVARYVDRLRSHLFPQLASLTPPQLDAQAVMSKAPTLRSQTISAEDTLQRSDLPLPYALQAPPSPLKRLATLATATLHTSLPRTTRKNIRALVNPQTYLSLARASDSSASLVLATLSTTGVLAAVATFSYAGSYLLPRISPRCFGWLPGLMPGSARPGLPVHHVFAAPPRGSGGARGASVGDGLEWLGRSMAGVMDGAGRVS